MVLATDPKTGQTEARRVRVTVTGDGAKNLVEATLAVEGAEAVTRPSR